jgi:hypothetical protein
MDTAKSVTLVDLEQQAISVRTEISALAITDQASYDLAVDKRTAAKSWLKNAEEWFDGIQKPAYEAYKNILTQRKLVCEPTEAAIKKINSALVAFDQEQERIRREEQRRLEEEARRKAEDERLQQAAEMESNGVDAETVNAVLDAPIAITAPVVAAPTYERSSQVVYRDNWSAECFDLFKLVQAVAKDKSKIGLLQVNQTALNQMAKALKESMAIPGCRAVNNKVVASGRG